MTEAVCSRSHGEPTGLYAGLAKSDSVMRSEALLKSLAEKLCGEGLRAEPSRSQAVGGPDDEVSTLHDRLRTASLDAKMTPWVAHRSMSRQIFERLKDTPFERPKGQGPAPNQVHRK